jgi:hypothetical protein
MAWASPTEEQKSKREERIQREGIMFKRRFAFVFGLALVEKEKRPRGNTREK